MSEYNPIFIPEAGVLEKLRKHKRFAGLVETIERNATSVPGGFWYDREDWENLRRDYGLAKSRGLGDTVGKIVKAVGVRKCPDPERKCNKRRQILNNAFPYRT